MNSPLPHSEPNSPRDDVATAQRAERRAIRIGSQRDVADKSLTPELPKAVRQAAESSGSPLAGPTGVKTVLPEPPITASRAAEVVSEQSLSPPPVPQPPPPLPMFDEPANPELSLDEEIEAALGGMSIEQLMQSAEAQTAAELEAEARVEGVVTRIHGDDVFLKLGGRFEGVVSLRQFAPPPAVGQTLNVVVKRYSDEDGLYEVAVPGAAVDVADWTDLVPGAIVEARVTGTNTGGLECLVNKISGFIPASQVALYRVENFGDFVNQKLACVVTESNAERRRLVLSRRAVLEREQAARREELLQSLQPGQTLMGIVTKLMDFGAFVDVGGIEGLVHISKLSWDRVNHPSEIVKVGEKIKVKVEKIAEGTGKLSLSFRDTLTDPWETVEQKYPVNSVVRGTVSRIAQFGAFVKLEPGIEGLIHISELAHHRVFAVKNVVNEGDAVEVKVLSIDRQAQRIGLSLKATQTKPEPKDAAAEQVPDVPSQTPAIAPTNQPLKGGRDRKTGGESVGLNW
jgi:small subunit ribosomal protein S1